MATGPVTNYNSLTHYDYETIKYDWSSQHYKYEEAGGVKVLSVREQPVIE